MAEATQTHCPYCSLQCGVELTPGVGGGLALSGREDFPVNRGGLCLKGVNAAELITHPERLTTPLARDRPGLPLRAVTWPSADIGPIRDRRPWLGQPPGAIHERFPRSLLFG